MDEESTHGVLLSLGEILQVLPENVDHDLIVSSDSCSRVLHHVPERYFGAYGSTYIFLAACHFITCITKAPSWVSVEEEVKGSYFTTLKLALSRPEDPLRLAAVQALQGYMEAGWTLPSDALPLLLKGARGDRSIKLNLRKGSTLALGSIKGVTLRENSQVILDHLIQASRKTV